ncbi:uncharacterized protein BJ171DRAFT_577708 [Polychytrium aggregatum]|uniref:uncharacterized protein n=1 Tax=Polychytrium aggregatum TaxID=110093 RepID=UPI0022FE045E|nr:uncharacterized protein BJ171DRAFT_577708 [Polychytrium aggregatum]KAI9208607.1 hypothetical protein BJ171DRAFT_577708 [Polychytrium aggregatum]
MDSYYISLAGGFAGVVLVVVGLAVAVHKAAQTDAHSKSKGDLEFASKRLSIVTPEVPVLPPILIDSTDITLKRKNRESVRSSRSSRLFMGPEPSPRFASLPENATPVDKRSSVTPKLSARKLSQFSYAPRKPDELALRIGDPVSIYQSYPDGWCLGMNWRSGFSGVFPLSYVDPDTAPAFSSPVSPSTLETRF